jgi:hypothetical protein
MPIEYQIDPVQRVVIAKAVGILTADDIFNYQREVWSLPEVRGLNELIDMSNVEKIVEPSALNMKILADFSASMDTPIIATKLAIVANEDYVYGLGRMYEGFRQLNEKSTKEVSVFRSMKEAMEWVLK